MLPWNWSVPKELACYWLLCSWRSCLAATGCSLPSEEAVLVTKADIEGYKEKPDDTLTVKPLPMLMRLSSILTTLPIVACQCVSAPIQQPKPKTRPWWRFWRSKSFHRAMQKKRGRPLRIPDIILNKISSSICTQIISNTTVWWWFHSWIKVLDTSKLDTCLVMPSSRISICYTVLVNRWSHAEWYAVDLVHTAITIPSFFFFIEKGRGCQVAGSLCKNDCQCFDSMQL